MNFIDILISAVLALIMFGIGASLTRRDFNDLFQSPKAIITGLILQMVFLPALAFSIVFLSPLSPAFAVGLFIVSLCPGGTTSNFISYIVNADVALSIALTVINSVIILFTIPTFSQLAINYFMEGSSAVSLSALDTLLQVFLIVLLPALIGLIFNESFGKLSKRIQNPLKYINTLLLFIVFIIKFFAGEQSGGSGLSVEDITRILPYALALHLLSIIISFTIAQWNKLSNFQSTTISIEVGLQNTALALLITGTLIGNNEMTKPALVYAMFSFVTTFLFGYIARRIGQGKDILEF